MMILPDNLFPDLQSNQVDFDKKSEVAAVRRNKLENLSLEFLDPFPAKLKSV